uniref:17S U2 SnRNP complex component HTATSF1 n=1 Tax=Glossina brevipalpis TaxID=37001 RepID=A0A1A9W771_9MUSC
MVAFSLFKMSTEIIKCSTTEESEEETKIAESTEELKQIPETLKETESEMKGQLNEENPVKEIQEITSTKSNNERNESENRLLERPEKNSPNNDEAVAETKIPSTNHEYEEHVTYDADGCAIYTDPNTKYRYKWCSVKNTWIPCNGNGNTNNENLYENEYYRWCSKTQKWLPKQEVTQQQQQVTETEHYKWNAEKQAWLPKQATEKPNRADTTNEVRYDVDEDGQRIYIDKDGSTFFWDVEKNAWFPKIDDDFMARYQMSYGFNDNILNENDRNEEENQKVQEVAFKKIEHLTQTDQTTSSGESNEMNKQSSKRKQEAPKWFDIDPAHNTKVYVSNLPLDITLDEFAELMGKCGLIMRDPQSQKFKLKLYTEADGQIKGDGLCDYIKVESVDLALKILDEYNLRGHKIRVQRAKFQMRGEYNPALKPKRKKKDREKLAKIKEKLFDWRPEKMRGERSKHEKIVIIKNLFQPEIFENEVQLILDYQNDLREECSKCGQVRKIIIYDRHSEGVAQVNMSTPEEADLVIQMMAGRFFGKRQLTAEHWDGKTKYKTEESEVEIQKRLNKWDQFLETEENRAEAVENSINSSKSANEVVDAELQQNSDTDLCI